MKIYIPIKVLLIILFIAPVATSYSTESNQLMCLEKSWFAPVLTENNHDKCSEVLEEAQKLFLSEKSYIPYYFKLEADIAGMQSVNLNENNSGVLIEEVIMESKRTGQSYKEKKPYIYLNGNKFYLHNHTAVNGCGGACELYQLLVSQEPSPENLKELEKVSPPPACSYKLFKAKDNSYWLYFFDRDDNLNTYQLQNSGSWVKTCQVNFHPPALNGSKDPVIQNAYKSLMEFKTSVLGLTRGAGSCGSMDTHSRWRNGFIEILPSVLYRPWALKEIKEGRFGPNEETYERDLVGLKDWSLMGLSEYKSFQEFLSTLDTTVKDIALFFEKKYGWKSSYAREIAETALTTAASGTIRFYGYNPIKNESERQLRIAILEKKPINYIENIPLTTDSNYHRRDESLLSLAVEYPEGLKILLDAGLNPNHENEFGKTPLMYAAQYNQYESVKILLEYGADPNARTTKPTDTCFYDINTFSMTPLHYSVRYASPEIIKLILDHGGAPFITAENKLRYPYAKETPLDWLKRYTQKNFEEKNPNIEDDKIRTIETWLEVPVDGSSPKEARELIIKAETQYQQKKVSDAYRTLGLALVIDSENERALSDMSLIALKNGKLGQSLEASNKLIENSTSDKLKANAWFNQGLACEKFIGENPWKFLTYNGNYYCTYGSFFNFYKAASMHLTNARKNKILEIFGKEQGGYCYLSRPDVKIIFQSGDNPEVKGHSQLQSFYILHNSDTNITGKDLAWTVDFYDVGLREVVPEKINSISFGDKMLSVFTTTSTFVRFPYEVFGHICTSDNCTSLKMSK